MADFFTVGLENFGERLTRALEGGLQLQARGPAIWRGSIVKQAVWIGSSASGTYPRSIFPSYNGFIHWDTSELERKKLKPHILYGDIHA
jgi:hypothetical protein